MRIEVGRSRIDEVTIDNHENFVLCSSHFAVVAHRSGRRAASLTAVATAGRRASFTKFCRLWLIQFALTCPIGLRRHTAARFRISGFPQRVWDLDVSRDGEVLQRRPVIGTGQWQEERFETSGYISF